MSDGDNATPGLPRPSDAGGDNHWLTRTPRPSRGAAPWERSAGHEPEDESAEPTGNHTDGVTVADLIAKVTGTEPHGLAPAIEPKRRRAEPEPEPLTTVLPAVGRRPGRTGHRDHPGRVAVCRRVAGSGGVARTRPGAAVTRRLR